MGDQLLVLGSGAVVSTPSDRFGYYGWPSACTLPDGTVVVVASGMRLSHVCPFGRTVLCIGTQEDGAWSWAPPRVIGDTPLDDRDAGIVRLSDGTLVVSWFTMHHGERLREAVGENGDLAKAAPARAALERYQPGLLDRWYGSWVRLSHDGGQSWSAERSAPVTAPHGPITLSADPRGLLYLGKEFRRGIDGQVEGSGPIAAFRSDDAGDSWTRLGDVPFASGSEPAENQEPHVCALADGSLLGMVRLSAVVEARVDAGAFVDYSMAETYSADGGRSWSEPRSFEEHGSTPHLLRHSSGGVVATFGYRQHPQGVRIRVAPSDDGASAAQPLRWGESQILRDDGVDGDVGYPATVELADGSLLTVSYGRRAPGDCNCSLLWTWWRLPGLR